MGRARGIAAAVLAGTAIRDGTQQLKMRSVTWFGRAATIYMRARRRTPAIPNVPRPNNVSDAGSGTVASVTFPTIRPRGENVIVGSPAATIVPLVGSAFKVTTAADKRSSCASSSVVPRPDRHRDARNLRWQKNYFAPPDHRAVG